MKYASAKGVFDIIPLENEENEKWRESSRWEYLEKVMRSTAQDYGFHEVRTPMFESTDLFVRSVGESSDIVSKEMYTFLDRGERSMTLRPEGTAPLIRSFVEHQLYSQSTLHKYFYIWPMFRYERPQAGRYRQFHQFGAEAIGNPTPEQDVELIDLFLEVCRRLQLKNLTVLINSVGDPTSRSAYKEALTAYLQPHYAQLSADSQNRFSKNILRILDSKDPKDQALLENAPPFSQFLSPECREHFEKVLALLEKLDIACVIEPKLVRGLDYYNKTVFEITSGELGAQNAVGGGGRYDGLVKALGGPDLSGVGFGMGIERLLQTMLKQGVPFPKSPHPLVFFIPMGAQALQTAFRLTAHLRHANLSAEIDLSGKKVQHGLQLANQLGAEYAIVLGEEELKTERLTLKHMATRETIEISFHDLLKTLIEKLHV